MGKSETMVLDSNLLELGNKILARIKSNPSLYNSSFVMLVAVCILFFLAPNDSTGVLPPLGGARFYWTPLIPLLTSFAILAWVFLTLEGRLETVQTKYASIGVPFLIFLSVQFVTTSPVGVDGWLFLSLSQQFSMFGQSGQASYLSHPLIMLPVDYSIRILDSSGRNMAALTGFALSLSWLNIVFTALSKAPSFRRNGVLLSLGLCLFFVATSWYPMRYSAHLLALVLGHFLIYKKNQDKISIFDLLIAFLLGVAHPFSPVVFGAILYFESILGKASSSRSRILFFVISTTFVLWNSEMDFAAFRKYLPINDPVKFELQIIFLSTILVAYFASILLSKKLGLAEKVIFGGAPATHNISVILGCIVCIPLLLLGDTTSGGSRFTHRLVTYSAVPFMWSGGWVLNKAFSYVEGQKITLLGRGLSVQTTLVAILAIFSGMGGAILQDSFVTSAQVMPENTNECWDALEESGSLGLISRESDDGKIYGGHIIMSPQLIPPLEGLKYYSFLRTGDGTRIPNTPTSAIKGVMETPGLVEDLADLTDLQLDGINWTVVGEVEGACTIWVHQESLIHLDTEMTWAMVDAKFP
tara:strand:+ start:557 stop:2308 length:1752 start_codon:yes stop_codon:yes gene_type:complete